MPKRGAAAETQESTFVNAYSGWRPQKSGEQLARMQIRDLTPASFFHEFVAKRRPVVITGHMSDAGFHAGERWTNEYLAKVAGKARVRCDVRTRRDEPFLAKEYKEMAFSDLLQLWARGDDLHYLTTEAMEMDSDGRLNLLSSPLHLLTEDFPLRPSLVPHMIPSNVNMWMGRSQNGASSGLHHDYHDNLYLLLRGKKHFELYSPGDAALMYCNGKIARVHRNGLINYEGAETNASGEDRSVKERVFRARREAAESLVSQAEEEISRGVKNGADSLKIAETILEQTLEDELQLMRGEEEEDDDDEDEDEDEGGFDADAFLESELVDDYVDSDAEEEEEEEEDEGPLFGAKSAKKQRKSEAGDEDDNAPIPHFSHLDRKRLRDFPLFAKATMTQATIQAGEMLFLPAGWFHEVTSHSSAAESNTHLALNYWFHPPQRAAFAKPYARDSLWSEDFANWKETIAPKLRLKFAKQ